MRQSKRTSWGGPREGAGKPLGEPTKVVRLPIDIADAAKRIGFDKSRPLLSVNPRQSWIKTMEARRPTYESLADHRVDTAGRDVEAVVAEALTLLEESA